MNNRCKTKGKWNESVNDRSIDGAHSSFSSSCNVSARQTQNQGSALKNISHKDIGGKKVKDSQHRPKIGTTNSTEIAGRDVLSFESETA